MDIPSLHKLTLGVLHAKMLVITHIHQSIVAPPAIGVDHAARINLLADDGLQRCFLAVWNDLRVNLPLSQEQAKHRLFARASPTLELTRTTANSAGSKVALIHLYLSHHSLKLLEPVGING